MKNSHKFWLVILVPLIIYLCFVSTIVLYCLLAIEFIFGFVFFHMFINNTLIYSMINNKVDKFLGILNPICWILLVIAYFNKWMDNELY